MRESPYLGISTEPNKGPRWVPTLTFTIRASVEGSTLIRINFDHSIGEVGAEEENEIFQNDAGSSEKEVGIEWRGGGGVETRVGVVGDSVLRGNKRGSVAKSGLRIALRLPTRECENDIEDRLEGGEEGVNWASIFSILPSIFLYLSETKPSQYTSPKQRQKGRQNSIPLHIQINGRPFLPTTS